MFRIKFTGHSGKYDVRRLVAVTPCIVFAAVALADKQCVPEWDNTIGQPGMEPFDQVRALAVYDGDVIAGGFFTSAGGVSANYHCAMGRLAMASTRLGNERRRALPDGVQRRSDCWRAVHHGILSRVVYHA